MTLATLAGVGVQFAGSPPVQALRGCSLGVGQGEFLALVGPSGCGKTTVLRLLAGLCAPTAGTLRLADTGSPIAYVPQSLALLPWLTTRDNVALPLRLSGVPEADANRRAQAALHEQAIGDFATVYPAGLSGGMAQRVALARALLQHPGLLLLDEPLSALDAWTREAAADSLQAAHLTAGATTVLVTHSLDEAAYLADRVLVLSPRPGRVVAEVEVHLPRPRAGWVRTTPAFAAVVAALRAALAPATPTAVAL